MINHQVFPLIRFNGGEVTCYGISPGGHLALIGRRVPMEERHLYNGVLGGMSKASLRDEKGQPKQVLRLELVPFCYRHQVAWLEGPGCPKCGQEAASGRMVISADVQILAGKDGENENHYGL